jgi:hypothetical protein
MAVASTVALGLTALGLGYFASRKPRASSGTPVPRSRHSILDPSKGPTGDQCLGAAYLEVAEPLSPEIASTFSESAKGLYGARPVFFLSAGAQATAAERLAYLRVHEPSVNAVTKVAQELAPGCKWLLESDWSAAMVAFRDSLEKISQLISIDLGEAPNPAWQTQLVLRPGRSLQVVDRSRVAIELPPGDGVLAVGVTVSPSNAGLVRVLGEHQHDLVTQQGSTGVPVLSVQLLLTGSARARFDFSVTRDNGAHGGGTIEVLPRS